MQGMLNAGLTPQEAWHAQGIMTDPRGVPYGYALELRFSGNTKVDSSVGIRTLCCASEIAACTGMSLASLLSVVTQSMMHETEAQDHRRIAMAGPKASALVLQCLPILGLLSAFLVGVNPFLWFVDSLWGLLCAALGCLFLVVGRKWTAALIEQASKSQHLDQ